MTAQNRTTLKTYFNTGDVPTEAQFGDFIDSIPSDAQQAALDAAGSPSGGNPFATQNDLPSAAQQAALDAATSPSGGNPFATQTDLPSTAQQAALDAANSPSMSNPFVTQNDLAYYNVQDYGATGNGVTDDATAIQAAITACPAGGAVFFPPTSNGYKFGTGLTISTANIRLTALRNTALSFSGTGNAITITGTDCLIENLSISASGSNAGYGIYINGGYGATLRNVTLWGFEYDQCRIHDAWWTTTYDCVFSTLDAGAGAVGFYHDDNSNDVNHYNSRFVGDSGQGGCYVEAGAQIGFYGCDFSGDGASGSYGCTVAGAYSVGFYGCYFETCNGPIILAEVSGVTPVNVIIRGCYFYIAGSNGLIGIDIDGVQGVTIDSNLFYGNDPTNTSTAIQIEQESIYTSQIEIGEQNQFLLVTTKVSDSKGRAWSTLLRPAQYASSVPANMQYYTAGQIVWRDGATVGQPMGWKCSTAGWAVKGNWNVGLSYTTGDFVLWVANIYRATTTGTSGGTPPTHTSGTASDGGVTWQFIASGVSAAVFTEFGQFSYRTGTQSPDAAHGYVLPDHVGEIYFDSTNYFWYQATNVGGRLWATTTVKCGIVQLASGSASVAFDVAMGDTNYHLALGGYLNETYWATAKAASGFMVNSSNSSSDGFVDWIVTR